MAHDNHAESRTSSPSLSDRVRSITTLRGRFGSVSRTTLSDELEIEPLSVDELDQRSKPPERAKSAASIYTRDHIFDQLHPSRSLNDRIRIVTQVAENAGSYPIQLLMTVWSLMQDMYREDAQSEARRACFTLATAIADLPDVPLESQLELYRTVVEPVPIEVLDAQVGSLKSLTRRGARTMPFSPHIGKFLTATLRQQFLLATEARKRAKNMSSRDPSATSRERGLTNLFILIANIEGQNPGAIESDDQSLLLQELFAIAERTSFTRDMKGVVAVLGPIIRASGIPTNLLSHCVELLCAISNAVEDVKEDTKGSLLFLLRSQCKQEVVQILLQTLSLALSERHTSIVCGALAILLELIKNKGQNDLPLVTFGQFIEPFSQVHYGHRTTRCACLQTISDLLVDQALLDDILVSDWKFMIDTILTATGDEIYEPGQKQPLSIESKKKSSRSSSAPDSEPHKEQQLKQQKLAAQISKHLQNIASSFNSLWLFLTHNQRELVARFYGELVYILPQESLLSLIDQILSLKHSIMADINFPGLVKQKSKDLPRTNYYDCFEELIEMFAYEQRIPPAPYGRIMKGLRDHLTAANEEGDKEQLKRLAFYVERLLKEFNDIQGSGWQKAVDLAKTVAVCWKIAKPLDFPQKLDLMTPLFHSQADDEDRQTSQVTDTVSLYTAHHGIANVTLALVDIFLSYLPHSRYECTILFEKFLSIVSNKELSASIRLPVLRLLARIRCDQRNSIFITSNADSLCLAAYLRRTEGTRDQLATFKEDTPRTDNQGRRSIVGNDTVRGLRRSRKSLDTLHKSLAKAPLWMYPGGPGLPSEPPTHPSSVCFVNIKDAKESGSFNINEWLYVVLDILQNEIDWEVYSYVIVHLPSQLANPSLFAGSIPAIQMLRSIIVSQLLDNRIMEPPTETNVKKGDVAFCLMQTLFILLGYAEHFSQGEQDEIVKATLHGIGTWDRTGQICVQALAVACYALPISIKRTFGAILLKLERYITHSNLTVDILEFLGGVARMRDIHTGLMEDEYRKVFAICIKYLEHAREQRSKLPLNSGVSRDYTSDRSSGVSTIHSGLSLAFDNKDTNDRHKHLPQYVFVLAYHVITFWFLATKLKDRSRHVGWISSKLAWKDDEGIERMEEQSQVTLDMMLRTAYSDLEESKPAVLFTDEHGPIHRRSWLVGLSIITIETAVKTGLSHVIKRQVSGTTYATYLQQTAPLPAHHIAMQEDNTAETGLNVFPHHVFLQLVASISPTPSPLMPICLPEDALVKRALDAFDRMDTVDGYRVGVIYIRDEQSTEKDILANTTHSHKFYRFLEGLGTKIALKGASFNTQGLDNMSDQDGEHTYAWRDRLVEIVYHVPSMMPNLEHEPQFNNKKRHIGNNHVTIIWNESGLPFKFDTFPSQFNSVNIVITPENSMAPSYSSTDAYVVPRVDGDNEPDDPRYTVQTITHQLFPRLSPCASAKLLPLSHLPALIRQMALNSAIFSNVWSNREDGEYVSSWRNRLREIVKLRERYINTGGSANSELPGSRGSRVYGQGDLFRGKVQMGGITEEEGILGSLDFSRWTGAVSSPSEQQGGPGKGQH